MGLDLTGFREFENVLNHAGSRIQTEMDKGIHRSAMIIQAGVIKGIKTQKWAGEWKALSQKTIDFKKRVNASPHILISGYRGGKKKVRGGSTGSPTGLTKLSNVPRANYVNSFAVAKIQNAMYAVGSNYPQARALEFGYKKRNLEARPHLGLAIRDSKEDIKKELDESIRKIFGKG